MTTVHCSAKHTRYQPPEDEKLVCRKCGNSESFWIQEVPEVAHEDCTILHDDDLLYCDKCNFEQSGRAYAAAAARRLNLVTCPCCKGKGMVPKEKAE